MNRILQLAFWYAAAFAFVMAVLPHPPTVPFEPGDKFQHMLAFATLAALGTLAYPRLSALRLAAGLAAFGAAIEFIQMIPALHRDAELGDWIADILAVALSLVVTRLILRWRANSPD